MTPVNRRQLTLSLLAGSLSTGIIGGCATTDNSEKIPSPRLDQMLGSQSRTKTEEEKLSALSITHPGREKELDEMWADVTKHTEATVMSDNRMRIKAKGKVFSRRNISEHNFFIRAAAETLRRGKDGFVIKQIDFYSEGAPWSFLSPSLNLSSSSWIGNYEDFRENRNEQNIFSSRRSIRNKAMDGVILLLDKTEFPNRDRFTAHEIYLNLLDYKSK